MNFLQKLLFGDTYRMRRRLQAPAMERLLREEVRDSLCLDVDARMVGRAGGVTDVSQIPQCDPEIAHACWWCRARAVLAEIDDKPMPPLKRAEPEMAEPILAKRRAPVTLVDGLTISGVTKVRCSACNVVFWDDGKVACPGCNPGLTREQLLGLDAPIVLKSSTTIETVRDSAVCETCAERDGLVLLAGESIVNHGCTNPDGCRCLAMMKVQA